MLKTQQLTRNFMETCNVKTSKHPTTKIVYDRLINLVKEEYEEFAHSMRRLETITCAINQSHSSDINPKINIWCEVIDAMCDLIVVTHNTSNAMGIDLEPFFDEVHKKNMEKQGGPKRDDGKQLKPEGWTPPDHESILKRIIGVEIDKQYSYPSIGSFCKDDVNKHTFKDGDPWNPPGPIHDDGPINVKVGGTKLNAFVDHVDHPQHYTFSKLEVIDAIEAWNCGFCDGNVIKYVARHKHKGKPIEDLKKAKWYLEHLIENLEKEK